VVRRVVGAACDVDGAAVSRTATRRARAIVVGRARGGFIFALVVS
jgi:hypothetical protein